jgi:hypothetical protein
LFVGDPVAKKGRSPGLERAVPKSKGIEAASLLHQLAAEYYAAPQGAKVRGLVTEIDPRAKERLTRAGKEKEATGAKGEGREKPAAKSRSRQTKATAGDAAESKKKSKTGGGGAKHEAGAKRSRTKQLSKKKPR